LVVVLIIGILSSVALPQYQKSVDRAKGVEALTTAKAVADAENVYFMANGVYEPSMGYSSALDIEVPVLKNWDIGTSTYGNVCSCSGARGCEGTVCDFFMHAEISATNGSPSPKATLMYSLENGQTVCRCCVGEKCQNYFGVKSGDTF